MLPILIGLLLFTVVAEAGKCKPGTTVRSPDGCNTCFCSKSGKLAACTLKACVKKVHRLVKRHVSEAGECEPGTTFLGPDGCNTCYCTESGEIGACTLKACNRSEHSLVKRHASAPNERECIPGITFIPDGDCNFCICSESGQNSYTCTRKMCNFVRSVKDEPCKPKKKKFRSKDGCNICKCQSKFAMCTMKNCGKW